jgi:EmrB/QacA subfamily drug resistance transporter
MRLRSSPVSEVRFESAQGRWVIASAVLGSGIAFLDGSVVNTALPHIRTSFHSGLTGQQWVVTAYLLTLGSLLVVGGAIGDLFGRRRAFVVGLVGFSVTSLACGLAPNLGVLIAARVLQGVAAALLVPGSLAMLSAVFHPRDRARAIGAWSGLAGVSTALGPFVGGWLIDTISWRWIFLINPLLAIPAIVISQRFVPETKGQRRNGHVDVAGAVTLSLGLGGVVYAMIEGPSSGWTTATVFAVAVGLLSLVAFAVIEGRVPNPMVPLTLFRSVVFAGLNAATLVMWGAIGAVFFLLTIHLQNTLGYSALEAGAATLPVTVLMLLFAARSGALAERIGPRTSLIVGPLVTAASFALMSTITAKSRYLVGVFPAITVFGIGLVITVAPLTATLLSSIDDDRAGVGSAINNAIARVAALLAIAVLPALSGMSGAAGTVAAGFARAMWICCVATTLASIICARTIPARDQPGSTKR